MINMDAAAVEAKYGNKTGPVQPAPIQDLYAPKTTQIPMGTPIPEGTIVRQHVGRGEPAIQVVPPAKDGPPPPQMAVMPPQGGNRTSIGTFIENTAKSNPMIGTVPVEPEQPAEPPPEPKKRAKLDLAQLILTHVWELGGEKSEAAQKFYDRGESTMKNWLKNPGAIPLECVNKFLHKQKEIEFEILDELEPHFDADGAQGWTQSLPNRGKMDCMVCMPVLGAPTLPAMWTVCYLLKKYELGLDIQADTMIHRSRNMLADRFLKSGCTWSLWLDSDIAAPINNEAWYRWITRTQVIANEHANYDVLARLMVHGKPIIGGVYASRQFHGSLVIQPDVRPRHHEDKLLANEIRKGTARGLAAVDWIGFGCALIHREVFVELKRAFPQLSPQAEYEPWNFFKSEGSEGEDEAFCKRARACSIPVWLDTQLTCGHIGNMAFMPEHTQAVLAM